MKIQEGRAPGAGGVELFWRSWTPEDPWASLLLVHGLGEHSGRYDHVARRLGVDGVSVFSFDLPGHGNSTGPRGDVPDFAHFLENLVKMEELQGRGAPRTGKRFLLGHSLGGLIALRHLQTQAGAYDGGIFSAPWLRVAQPDWLRSLGRGLGLLLPGLPLINGLGANRLTRDPGMVAKWREDPLIHSRITGRLFREAERVQGEAMRDGGAPGGPPLLFLVPENDPVVSSPVTLSFAEGFADTEVQVEILLGRLHEAFNDLGREEVFDLMARWMTRLKS